MKGKFVCSIFLLSMTLSAIAQTSEKPNVVLIFVDDLNDYVEGFDGHPQVKTPNINRIAAQGVSFLNTYCSAPGCAPSRTSMLSGKDLSYTHVFNNDDYDGAFRNNFTAEEGNAEVHTLPQTLKDDGGYYTYAINKIFHSQDENDMDYSERPECDKNQSWNKLDLFEESEEITNALLSYTSYDRYSWAKVPDSMEQYLEDTKATDYAINFIDNYANGSDVTCGGKPFFLAIGYHRPHSGRLIPEKYFPQFYNDDIYATPYNFGYNVPANAFPYNGIVMPPQPEILFGDYYAFSPTSLSRTLADASSVEPDFSGYLSSLAATPSLSATMSTTESNDIFIETQRANYVMAYIAAVQYVDAQIGRLLDAMETHPELYENTVFVFVSDHGYSLGEKKHYTKWALWETDIRVPLIISTPGMNTAKVCEKTVSMLDIFPTLCDLTETDKPHFQNGTTYLDGASLVPLLNNTTAYWYKPALTTYKRNSSAGSCFPHYSVRTEKYHYIRYQTNNGGFMPKTQCDAVSSKFEEELYDIGTHREIDPYEWNNLAANPEYADLKSYLQQFLPGGSLYLQKAMKVEISETPIGCYLSNTGSLKMKAKLYDENGNLLLGTALNQYRFTWTNNVTAHTSLEKEYTFKLNLLNSYFASIDHITFYLKVTNITTGEVVAFEQKTYAVNDDNSPAAEFGVETLHNTVNITSYNVTGSYEYSKWDMGDGFVTYNEVPGPHTYTTAGNYIITNTLYFGNGCSTTLSAEVLIQDIMQMRTNENSEVLLYPNPASDYIKLLSSSSEPVQSVEIYNMYGQLLKVFKSENLLPEAIDVNDLQQGNYLLKIYSQSAAKTLKFEIIR